jgi:hypothetical protein
MGVRAGGRGVSSCMAAMFLGYANLVQLQRDLVNRGIQIAD